VSADYSQIELRLLAHFAGDEPLVEAFRAGEDIHTKTAALVLGVPPDEVDREMRGAAKAVNFGLIYGMSAFRLSRDLGWKRARAQAFIDRYFASYPKVRGYLDGSIAQARDKGYAETRFGRRRPVRGIHSRRWAERGAAERIAMNAPIQGSAADTIKIAMVRVHRRLARDFPGAHLLLNHTQPQDDPCPSSAYGTAGPHPRTPTDTGPC